MESFSLCHLSIFKAGAVDFEQKLLCLFINQTKAKQNSALHLASGGVLMTFRGCILVYIWFPHFLAIGLWMCWIRLPKTHDPLGSSVKTVILALGNVKFLTYGISSSRLIFYSPLICRPTFAIGSFSHSVVINGTNGSSALSVQISIKWIGALAGFFSLWLHTSNLNKRKPCLHARLSLVIVFVRFWAKFSGIIFQVPV